MDRNYHVYILTNGRNTVLYTGITNDLRTRLWQHQNSLNPTFCKDYRVRKLVHFEIFDKPLDAIKREKQIKGWLRGKKINLINAQNPGWRDLSMDFEEK